MNKSMQIQLLSHPDQIDLGNHGVIEAHAGAGKTYTIVKMVLRILQEVRAEKRANKVAYKRVHIREVLLVTFTEKAAGELKKRIREGLEERIEKIAAEIANTQDASERSSLESLLAHLSDCLNNLHEALIGTIHGVCMRLLQTWPFETGVQFTTTIVDDEEGLESCLRQSIRTDWQTENSIIPWALQYLGSHGISLRAQDFERIRALAKGMLDRNNVVLERTLVAEHTLATLHDAIVPAEVCAKDPALFQQLMKDLALLAESLTAFEPPADFHENALHTLQERKDWVNAVLTHKVAPNLEQTLTVGKYSKPDKNGVLRKSNLCDTDVKKTKTGKALSLALDGVSASPWVQAQLQWTSLLDLVPLTLICDATELLRDRWLQVKQEQGLISFQDMLHLMLRAVENSATFREALRSRLHYAIIDEFQDTSILQWSIFQRLILVEQGQNDPMLFLVGDPKQSIYSFQGADVNSYLDAKQAIADKGGKLYGLVNNFRSSPALIQATNEILGSHGTEDWFMTEQIKYPAGGAGGGLATSPNRAELPPADPFANPVQVMLLEGSAGYRTSKMAEWASQVIQSLVGKIISIPKGDQWESISLQYEHFAVIVEGHKLAEPFLESFQAHGIPAVKYKMQGVFQSALALDLRMLLRALAQPNGDPALRIAVLLTRFFNKHPAAINTEKDLEQGTLLSRCLEEWQGLVQQRRWSLLFRSILVQTQVQERLLHLAEGERQLADLRQIMDHCMDLLIRHNYSLAQVVESLAMLYREEIDAGQDKNLHSLSTERSSVRVLSMHASKGLEFPIVFVVAKSSAQKSRGAKSWIASDHKQHLLPLQAGESLAKDSPEALLCKEQQTQERRRLLYVALTRPQSLLFVPLQVGNKVVDASGKLDWEKSKPKMFSDNDLSPVLTALLNQGRLKEFDLNEWPYPKNASNNSVRNILQTQALAANWTPSSLVQKRIAAVTAALESIAIPKHISHQTSYTELSQNMEHDRSVNPSEELEDSHVVSPQEAWLASDLPRGKDTGDALHLALEHCIGLQDLTWVSNDASVPDSLRKLLRGHLERNQVLKKLPTEAARALATEAGLRMVRRALHTNYSLGLWGNLRIADLPKESRRAELEFQLSATPDWLHGFMDLVYRIPMQGGVHPWRYFVLDWKSNSLPEYSSERIATSIVEDHYDLQAKVYSYALHCYLRGLLKTNYDPALHLGGAVYVYLRGLEHAETVPVWVHTASPSEDAAFVDAQLRNAFPRIAK